MNEFRLNLIRDQVPDKARRRMRYGAMLLYLGIAGLVLAMAVGLASGRVAQAMEFRDQSRRLEKAYAASHEGQGDIRPGALRLQSRLAAQLVSLKAVEERLASDARPARLLRALTLSLPAHMSLHKVTLSAEEKMVAFELRLLGSGSDNSIGAPELMSRWQQDPAITAEITQLAYLGSQTEKAGANGNMILQFSGRLEKGRH